MEIQNMSEEDWEVLDYYCYAPEEEDDEKQKWWKMGNWVKEAGKKLVMTGIVVSSAPVVLPPLLVVSALGLAMSFPFGVVFASYACTHKLMTKLLPLPPPNIIIPQQDEDEMKKESEIRIELLEDEIDDEQVGEENVEARLEEEREVQHAKLEPHHQESSTTSSSSTSSSQNENENGSINIDEEITKNEELDNEKIEQQSILVNDNAAAAATLDKQQNKTTDQPPPQHKQEVSVSEPKKAGEDSDNGVVVNGDSDKESEAKIWEKINAIRVIVGFKAPRRSSYLEEIKALYLFTGIDPPSPSSELDTNLSFLMSVIGLK